MLDDVSDVAECDVAAAEDEAAVVFVISPPLLTTTTRPPTAGLSVEGTGVSRSRETPEAKGGEERARQAPNVEQRHGVQRHVSRSQL